MGKTNIYINSGLLNAALFRRLLRLVPLIMALIILLPTVALATQIHGHPEGLYAHMMAHIFFAFSLAFLLYILYRRPLSSGKGWRYLKLSLLFFLLWNIDTFIVHWLLLRFPQDAIITGKTFWLDRFSEPMTMGKWIFYWGRMDHLLCVPAMGLLVLGLKAFLIEAEQKHRQQNNEEGL